MFRSILRFFLGLGAFGLVLLGVLDSSFLFLPLGNDLLLVALTARKPDMFWFYAIMAAAGSLLGCMLTDFVSRKLGQVGLERMVSAGKLKAVQGRMEKHTSWVLGAAAMMPPPFPFTVFLIAASALQISRFKVLMTIGIARLVRFLILGLLAVKFGRGILALAKRDEVQYFMIGLAIVSIVGSALSIWNWVRSARGRRGGPAPQTEQAPAKA